MAMLRGLFPAHADWIINDVLIPRGRPLGSGAFGEVRQATWKGCPVAAKKLHDIFFQQTVVPEEQCRRMVAEFATECALQAQLRHPNIVPLYGVYIPAGGEDGAEAPVMVTELMAETLRARATRAPRLTVRDVVDLSLDIASGLRFLHERDEPIGHRDLSANNVMLSSGGVCKIGDVGLAKIFTPARRLTSTMKPGAELYMPGEALSAHARYNEKIDVFSLGVLMMEMALGHEPRPQAEFTVAEVVNGETILRIIPESRRRQAELNELGEHHPLRPLIERLLLPQATRPAIGEVFRALEELRNHPAYVSSPSTMGSAEAVSARLANDLRGVQASVVELTRRQRESDERLQRLQEQQADQTQATRELQEDLARDNEQLRQDSSRQATALEGRIAQSHDNLQRRLEQGLARNATTFEQRISQSQDEVKHHIFRSHDELERISRSHDKVQRAIATQQHTVNSLDQRLEHLRRDLERSHNSLEQRMNEVASQLLDAVNAVQFRENPLSRDQVDVSV